MKILIQFGDNGDTLVDHLLTPIARAENVEEIMLVCRRRGPEIQKIIYYYPPGFLAKFALLAIIYEFFTLLFLSVFKKPNYIGGYLLFPHITLAFIAAKLTGKPLIASLISGPYELYTKGTFKKYSFNNPLPWHGKIFLKLLKHSEVIITTGKFTEDFLIKQGIDSDRIFPMINPPNETKFHPVDLPKKYDVICVSNLLLIKHIDTTIRAIAKVKENHPNIQACVVGDGPYKRKLMNLAEELGVENNIEFAGFQTDVAFYYNSSRIFIHTSEREGFPNVFLEASMCGLPSVVSNCGDIISIAQNGYNCMVIPDYRDHEAFATAIISLLDDKALYDTISQNIIKSVQKLNRAEITLTWEEIFSKHPL